MVTQAKVNTLKILKKASKENDAPIWAKVADFVQKSLILVWKIMILHVLFDLNHQKRSKTIKNRKINPGELIEFFWIYF